MLGFYTVDIAVYLMFRCTIYKVNRISLFRVNKINQSQLNRLFSYCIEYSSRNSRRNLRNSLGILIAQKWLKKKGRNKCCRKQNSWILDMKYTNLLDELYLVDLENNLVLFGIRKISQEANDWVLDYAYIENSENRQVDSVCFVDRLKILIVCLFEHDNRTRQLILITRVKDRKTPWSRPLEQKVKLPEHADQKKVDSPMLSCAVNDLQVLIGQYGSNYIELYIAREQIEDNNNNHNIIKHERSIHVANPYRNFSAITCGAETFVAMSYESNDNTVKVHRLVNNELVFFASYLFAKSPYQVILLHSNERKRLLVAEFFQKQRNWRCGDDPVKGSHAVKEISAEEPGEHDMRNESHRELISPKANINVYSWCVLDDGIAIFNRNTADIHFKTFNN